MAEHRSLATSLRKVRGYGSAKSGTEHFFIQRMTALANVPLALCFIWIVASLSGANHQRMVAYVSHPLVAILLLLFILSATIHMRIGMQVIIEDYVHADGPKVLSIIASTFFAICIGLAGVYAVLRLSFGI